MPNIDPKLQPSLLDAPKGLADMLAAALRGATTASLGFPGDMEGIGRMLIGNKNPTFFPGTDDVSKMLPPMTPLSTDKRGWDVPEKLGQFLPAPTVLAAVPKAKAAISALRKPAGSVPPAAPVDQGRRQAMKIGGAGAVTAATAPHMLAEALRAAPTSVAPEAAVVAKTAAKGVGRIAAMRAAMGSFIANGYGDATPEIIEKATKDIPYKFLRDMENAGWAPEDFPTLDRWAKEYNVEMGFTDEVDPKWAHFDGRSEEAEDAVNAALDAITPEEALQIAKAGPDAIPQSLLDAGVTPYDISGRLFPMYGRGAPFAHEVSDSFGKVANPINRTWDLFDGESLFDVSEPELLERLKMLKDWKAREPDKAAMIDVRLKDVQDTLDNLRDPEEGIPAGSATNTKPGAVQQPQTAEDPTKRNLLTESLKLGGAAAVASAISPHILSKILREGAPEAAASVKAAVPEAAAVAKEAAPLVSRLTQVTELAKRLNKAYGNPNERAASGEELFEAAREHFPSNTEDEIAQGFENFSRLYTEHAGLKGKLSYKEIMERYHPEETEWEFTPEAADGALRDIFLGKLDPADLTPEVLSEIKSSDHVFKDMLNSLSGIPK